MITDIIIIVILAFGIVVGFRQGLITSLITLIGMIIVISLSFALKNPVSVFLYSKLPFFDFGGLSMLNLLLYELVAFFIVFTILSIVFSMLYRVVGFIEDMMNATIILGIPTKFIGAFVGLIEGYILAFIVLYVLSFPSFSGFISPESKLKDFVLTKTPILSQVADTTLLVFNDFAVLTEKYANSENKEAMNGEVLCIFLKYNIVTPQALQTLEAKNKIGNLAVLQGSC